MQTNFDKFPGFSELFEKISLEVIFLRNFSELSQHLLFGTAQNVIQSINVCSPWQCVATFRAIVCSSRKFAAIFCAIVRSPQQFAAIFCATFCPGFCSPRQFAATFCVTFHFLLVLALLAEFAVDPGTISFCSLVIECWPQCSRFWVILLLENFRNTLYI